MYSQHFGLQQDPFSIAPDPRYLFMSERHREALAHLLYGVAGSPGQAGGTGGGFVLLTGDIGTGKTTICRCFLEQIPSGCRVAYIFNPKLSVLELLQSIVEEFHIDLPGAWPAAQAPELATPAAPAATTPTLKSHIDALNAFLLRSHAAGQSCVLVIDEAQNLQADVLEQLRLLTNLETNERKLLQIVLIGQPELRTVLARPEMEQLAQRVVARFHLDALTEPETAQYVAHRLTVAGHTGALPFDRAALRRIHQLTKGVPRRINLLCGRALLGAWAQGLTRVDARVVGKAATEVFGPPFKPSTHTPSKGLQRPWVLGVGVLVATTVGAAAVVWVLQTTPDGLSNATTATTDAPLGTQKTLGQAAPALLGEVTAASAASTAPASGAPASPPPTTATPLQDLPTVWPLLPTDMDAAWRELAPIWALTAKASDAHPCDDAALAPLQCYRTSKLSLPLLKQMNRPGILTLQDGKAPAVYATLLGLDEQSSLLRTGGQLHRVRWAQVAALWRGDFATYWRPPTGYNSRMDDGSTGPAVTRLAQQLATLNGSPPPAAEPPPSLDAALREQVRAFQSAHGLTPDGRPGAMTFMQLDNTSEAPEPRLQSQF